ncbi:hypothetical protein [Geodermatophilus poikilotrophus]|uniref:Uncharacterized protein n=1 Tax=Geodermatophilus poikilotrophus TaxID=1333667 RepID=A0A1I0D1I3_9ACTN|nr:hypothetical protein [Geodermatophilus poikilotrophus]SET25947.1 hypothetical protein SAMN04488546_1873 [Geodermatophilus poikilotrophus]
MPTAARRTTTDTPRTLKTNTGTTGTGTDRPTGSATTSTPGETRGTEPATGKAPARSGAAARTRTATRARPTGSALTHVAGAPVDPERAGGTPRAARSTAAARTGTATPQRPAATAATSAPGATPTTDQAAELAQQMTRAAVEKAAALGSGVAHSVRTVVTLPVTATAAVVDDVVSTVRRPDAVLYGGALVGLAAFGLLEWPVAAAVGVGVAVAGGVRRART